MDVAYIISMPPATRAYHLEGRDGEATSGRSHCRNPPPPSMGEATMHGEGDECGINRE